MATVTLKTELVKNDAVVGTVSRTVPRRPQETGLTIVDRAAQVEGTYDDDDVGKVNVGSGKTVDVQVAEFFTLQERGRGDFTQEAEVYLRPELGEFAPFLARLTATDG